MPNETDPVALAREALETYKVDEWPTMCALAQAVLDKDAQIRQIAHAQVAYAPPFCVELLKELQGSRDMWQNGHMELRGEIEKRDARIKDLEAALLDLINFPTSRVPLNNARAALEGKK